MRRGGPPRPTNVGKRAGRLFNRVCSGIVETFGHSCGAVVRPAPNTTRTARRAVPTNEKQRGTATGPVALQFGGKAATESCRRTTDGPGRFAAHDSGFAAGIRRAACRLTPLRRTRLRQVPQSCGIPSHDGTQSDRMGERRRQPGRLPYNSKGARRQSPGLGTVDAAEWRHAAATGGRCFVGVRLR
jgi:hypothetical protein